MSVFTCDQTIRLGWLKRRLDRMNPKTGIRRRLLDLFYESGTRWTWHTALGLVLGGVPHLAMIFACLAIAAVLYPLSLAFAWLLDLTEDILGWFSGRALQKYFRLQKDIDGIIASGNTEP